MKAILSNKESVYPDISRSKITITGSKSITNRLLLLQAFFPNISIENISNSDDTSLLIKGLRMTNGVVDVHHSGTAFRFLTAYFASQKGINITLTGSKRMQERPIKILVEALKELGAKIQYLKKEGFPPLQIHGKKLLGNTLKIKANISSQYITALMLIAPSLSRGLKIKLDKDSTSRSYIKMTFSLLQKTGIPCRYFENDIVIDPINEINDTVIFVESDWSSASYFYSIIALSENKSITLKNFVKNSLQGDSVVVSIYKTLGVNTIFNDIDKSITLRKSKIKIPNQLSLDLKNTPDIAQTIAITCFGLGISCKIIGLQTLKIKETDRLLALKIELEKLGAEIKITTDSFDLEPSDKINKNITIDTYQDHRLAMAFMPIALKTAIKINDPNVVSKSYPNFWKDVVKAGLNVQIK